MVRGPEGLSGCKGTSGRAQASAGVWSHVAGKRVLYLEVEEIEQMQGGLRMQEGEWMNLGPSHNLLSSAET